MPPWLLQSPIIDFNIHYTNSKKDYNYILANTTFEYINKNFNHCLRLYTDASRDPESGTTAIGLWIPQFKVSITKRISDVSICRAEQAAIIIALEWLEDYRPLQAIVLTDSLSTLMLLNNYGNFYKDPLIYEILLKVNNLVCSGVHLTLLWVPSHCGIHGNEEADSLAKKGLNFPIVSLNILSNYSECKNKIIYKYIQLWQDQWNSSSKGRFLYKLNPIIKTNMNFKCPSRRHEIVLHRLRLGKVLLSDYLFSINSKQSDLCTTCNSVENIEHVLLHCNRYVNQRIYLCEKLAININNLSLQHLLSNPISFKNTLDFIQHIGLLMKL